jgi:hypothetical protein
MFNPLPTNGNRSPEPPLAHPGAPPDSGGAKQPALPGTPYKPYPEKPGLPEPPYKPYAERPLDESPYEPYKGM